MSSTPTWDCIVPLYFRLSVTTTLSGGRSDRRGCDSLQERRHPVPPRDVDLATVVLDRMEQPFGYQSGIGDQSAGQPAAQVAALGEAVGLDQTGKDGVDVDVSRRELRGG